MKISYPLCEATIATLPIGYYAGRRIGLEMSKDMPTSAYSPSEDKIFISYDSIAKGLENVPDDADPETTIRSMMYHEVSHAILTPISLDVNEIINIFEDERIETVLRNYYLNVNFKELVYNVNGGIHDATNPTSAFYNLVRFGYGPDDLLAEANRILKKFASLHRNSDDVYRYSYDIMNLYDEVRRRFKYDPTAFNPPPEIKSEQGNTKSGGTKGKTYMQDIKSKGQQSAQQASGQPGQSSQSSQEGQEGQGEGFAPSEEEGEGESEQNMAEMVGDPAHGIMVERSEILNQIRKGTDIKTLLSKGSQSQLAELQKTAETIISNFNKKNRGGNGMCAYSGVFNPRQVTRSDYRFFERSTSTNGNNKFGTCHLNLFIDCSGSFRRSESLVNGMLAVLSEIERKYKNFSLDVVFCGEGIHKCESVKDRQIECRGGNYLPQDMKQQFMKLQKQGTCNYNIVLFDGDAFSDRPYSTDEACKIFHTFDAKQTILITDSDNEYYMRDKYHFDTAKVIVTNDYTDELLKHITQALTVAFN